MPAERIKMVPAFTHVGLDFVGPLYLKVKNLKKESEGTVKSYVCIFVCEETRAAHFELTLGMTTK